MSDTTIVPESKTGDEGKDPSQSTRIERTPEEIARYNLNKKADEARALGIDPKEVLGSKSDDEVPAWYKAEKAKEAQKTSLQMAEAITDEDLKERVRVNLGRIVPSENPEEDFRMALGAASASKNKQVVEEISRYTAPRMVASGGSSPASGFQEEFTPTAEESAMMAKPYFLSKEQVLAARKATQAKS